MGSMAGNVVEVEDREGGVRTVLFARPGSRNAFNSELYSSCADALNAADSDEKVSAVILSSSTTGIFTSGADLHEGILASDAENWREKPVGRFMLAVLRFRKLLVAAVDGPAVGIGVTLLMYCDLVWATPRATFWVPFLGIGIVPEFGSSVELQRVVGRTVANEMLLGGKKLGAEEALAAGLVGRILARVTGGRVADMAATLTSSLFKQIPAHQRAFRLTKRLANPVERWVECEKVLDAEFAAIAERIRAGDTHMGRTGTRPSRL